MDFKGTAGEVLERIEEHVLEKWRKGDSCYIRAESLMELCSVVMWKVELKTDELGYLGEEISKQIVEGQAWFLLSAYSKV